MKKVDDKNKPKDDKDKGKDVKKPLLDKKGKPIIEPEPEEIIPPPIKESMFYYKITEKQQQNSHSAGSNLFAAGHAVQTQTVNTATNNDSDVESLFSNR